MKFGTDIDDDEQWLSKYLNHFVIPGVDMALTSIVTLYHMHLRATRDVVSFHPIRMSQCSVL